MTDCLFCKMGSGEIVPHVVYEDDDLLAFLVLGPIREGHTLAIPREHYDYFDDLPPLLAGKLIVIGQKIAAVQKRLYQVDRVAFLFSGGDIPHAHAHIVPMVEKTDITSTQYIREKNLTFQDIPKAKDDELASVALKLRTELETR